MKKEADIRDSIPVVRELLHRGMSVESALGEMRYSSRKSTISKGLTR